MKKILFAGVALTTLAPFVSSGVALLAGVVFALTLGNPFAAETKKFSSKLLQLSVVGLGFGVNLLVVGQVGLQGVGYTILPILLAMGAGLLLGRILGVPRDTSVLISCGTAICGGSAIAAVSAAMKEKNDDVAVALAVVFLLNAAALFLFPGVGHYFQLSQAQFGLWSALAVHDTSSVLGTASQSGAEALQVGTTVKLARALWITPLALVVSYFYSKKGERAKITVPYFIFGFMLASAIVTVFPALKEIGHQISWASVRLLVFVLFLIGASLSRATLRAVGALPLVQGVALWMIMAGTTLLAIDQILLALPLTAPPAASPTK